MRPFDAAAAASDDLSARPPASAAARLTLALAAALALSLSGCGGGSDPAGGPTCTVVGVTVTATPATFQAGGATTLTATLDATAACAGGVTWSVSPPAGGTLTPSGLGASFTASTPGTYTITARSADDTGKQASAAVTVDPVPPACVVAGVTVTATPAAFVAGGSASLTAVVDATAACAGGVTWSVSPPTGGTLTPSGLGASFTASTPGAYTITATSADDAGALGTATVTVDPAPPACVVAGVTVSATPTSFVAGGSASLTAAVDATAACAGGVTWSVSPPSGGTLTPGGLTATFAAATPGTYTITARSVDDAGQQGSATVTVDPAPPACLVTGVTVSATPTSFEAGGSSSLTAAVTATAQCTRALTWTVSPEAGGTLTPSGLTATFTASTPGAYTITATSVEDAARLGSATVTVTPALPCTVGGLSLAAGPPAISAGGTSILTATLTASAACTRALEWSVSAGGALTASGATAAFTAAAQAAYTVTVRSLDDAARTATATVTVGPAVACGQPNGSVVTHPGGTVVTADETWVGDGVTHHLPGSVSISGTATVTIQPCAIVTLGPIASILVSGSARLVAAGTGGGRFVEIGAATAGVRWGMISASGPGALVDLRFTNVREGGETVGLPMMLSGDGGSDAAPPSPRLRVQSVEISGSGGLGVSLSRNATFTADSANLVVKDSAGYPLRANLAALGTLPSGDYTQNARKEGADEILVHGTADLSADMTIRNLGVPYRFEVPVARVQPAAPATGPVTLTIQPGVVLKFPRRPLPGGLTAPGALFSFGTAGLAPNGAGVLHAVGTPAAPIVFTSGEAAPAPGDWQGLWLATAAGSRLEHVELRYAGAPVTLSSGNCRPTGTSDAAALLVGNLTGEFVPAADLLTGSTIADSAGHGIGALWQAAAVDAPVLTTGNAFTGLPAGRCAQTFNGLTGGGICPAGGGCTTP